ncbi:flagellar hook-associated protein FlgK [Pseudolysinimonas sp.]|uniref:flagellar hook-associated protein FlgK n=1 Tax=Pseudolysinimonas sp. TaxID=2680009 RepID=UPI003F7E0113
MTSTFGLLNTASTALAAARAGSDVIGQNIANSATPGYVRQRVDVSSIGAVRNGLLSNGVHVGAGVQVNGVVRLADPLLDARVQTTSAVNGFWSVQSGAMSTLETSLNEPGASGTSAALQKFWAAWQDMGSHPGSAPQAGVLLQTAGQLSATIAAGYRDVVGQWSAQHDLTASTVANVNDLATRVAALNGQIRTTVAGGGNANELLDQRAKLTTQLADLSGATVRDLGNGTVDVVLGGNSLVSGDTARPLALAGATELAGAGTNPVHLEWADAPGIAVQLDGGRIAGGLAVLSDSGPLVGAANAYSALATSIATQVNAVHSAGATTSGTTGLDFFSLTAGAPAAVGLTVVPTDASGIATGAVGAGALDGSTADAIAKLGTGSDGPDAQWSAFVVATGTAAATASTQSGLATASLTSATSMQASQENVDMDEETTNLLMWQHAYQGAARVLTTIDDMLDTLINKTGLVGR